MKKLPKELNQKQLNYNIQMENKQNETKIKNQGSSYKEFEDGTIYVSCITCQKEEKLDPETARMKRSKGVNFNDYLCIDCWKEREQSKTQSNIYKGMSFNKACDVALALINTDQGIFDVEKEFDEILKKYYKKFIKFLNEN